jgi:hypothetical protein
VAYFYSTPHTRSDLFPQFTFSLNVGISLTGGRTQCLLTDVEGVVAGLLNEVTVIAGEYFHIQIESSLMIEIAGLLTSSIFDNGCQQYQLQPCT